MSSPSPEPQKQPQDHSYQPSENSDHAALSHGHTTCHCSEKITQDQTKTEPKQSQCMSKTSHHHNVLNLSHIPPSSTNHLHPINQAHVHQNSPKCVPKSVPSSCSCHLKQDDVIEELEASQRKLDDDRIDISPHPPALPPRPPPRSRLEGSLSRRMPVQTANTGSGGIRKYVFWCIVCGGLATILGAFFLAVYFMLRSYTSTLGYFETIPTFVPAAMLILTGICVMSLARRKNRYSYLIKVCGLCCLVCALTCVLVTITTTVIHMNRLQTLRECVYSQITRTCTCYSVPLETKPNGSTYAFDATPSCEVIHGALYSCLRAMFGLSVSGILVCIFSCMLVYQLLSHEKKKMYWEQLELRCRSFYQQHTTANRSIQGSIRGQPVPSSTYCSCCEECRYPPLINGPQVYPWETHHPTERFWTPGRIGNFYSPNPGEEVPQVDGEGSNNRNRVTSSWSWRRLPWSRGNTNQNEDQRENSLTYQGIASSADSQYGFTNRPGTDTDLPIMDPMTTSTGSYSILDSRPPLGGVYVWGPPPPYSNPNSPARRPVHSPSRYHHVHHHMHGHESHCQMNEENQFRNSRRTRPHLPNKDNYENTTETEIHQPNDNSESTDTSSCADRISHTLPVRKMKKRGDMTSVKSTNQCSSSARTNVQNIFKPNQEEDKPNVEHDYNEPGTPDNKNKAKNDQQCRFLPRLQGVENAAFQKQENSPPKQESAESEVYFADVSSCCNISVRNDGQDSSLYDEAIENDKPARLMSLQSAEANNQVLQNFQENNSTTIDDEDYLAHRMGSRQISTRSRLPFPLPSSDERSGIPKDISQNSLCSSVQTPNTETTDDAITPVDCYDSQQHFQQHFLAPDAQYEVIQEQSDFRKPSSNLTTTISGLSNFYNQNKQNFSYTKNLPPKSLNLNPPVASRRNIGTNISSLIQNLGGHPAGLLYGEASAGEEEVLAQGSHSDGTMDSGWQSGSERQPEHKKNEDSETHSKLVNVS